MAGFNDFFKTFGGPVANAYSVENVDHAIAGLDPETSAILDKQNELSKRTDADFAANATEGVRGSGSGLLGAPGFSRSSALGMREDAGQQEALQNRSKRFYDSQMNALDRKAAIEAPGRRGAAMAQTQKSIMEKGNMDNLAQQRKAASDIANQAARNAAIASLGSGVGTAVGAIFGMYTGKKGEPKQQTQQGYQEYGSEGSGRSTSGRAPLERI
jgi:hypothetical protein